MFAVVRPKLLPSLPRLFSAVGEAMVAVAAPLLAVSETYCFLLESWYITSSRFVALCDAIWDSIPWLLCVSSWHYLQPRHWPTHIRICSKASYHLTAAWQTVRSTCRDPVMLLNDRCITCGWLTGKLCVDEPLCYECGNCAICGDCTFAVPDLGRRWYDCSTLLQYVDPIFRPFMALVNHACEASVC